MKVSLEWVSDFVDLPDDLSPAQLAHELTLKTVEVEEVLSVDGDVVLQIDNKSLTNRPDLWGHYGIARELAVIFGRPLRTLPAGKRPKRATGLVGQIDRAIARRLVAMEFTVDAAVPTPQRIQARLCRIGEAPVSLCVDLSNYVMFTVGQPTHVYDADRITLPLSVAPSTTVSTVDLLNGQKIELAEATPVVRDARSVVGVAGVMGNAASAVAVTSQRFVLEVASFRAESVRRSSQRLALRTEASSRFEKGLDTQRADLAVGLFLHLLAEAAPTARAIGIQDKTLEATAGNPITVSREFLDRCIGEVIDPAELQGTLDALGFTAHIDDTSLRVVAPSWRSTGDVSLPHDILEEIARIHGYDRLAIAEIPATLRSVRALHRKSLSRSIREELARRGGLQDVITYPWVADHLLAAAGFAKDDTVRFEGAPAPDRDSLRPSLLPSLLEAVVTNLRYTSAFSIFEIGEVFAGGELRRYQGIYEPMPAQTTMLGIALVGPDGVELFRRAKGLLEMLRRFAGIVDLQLDGDSNAVWADQSARVGITTGGAPIGTLALLTPRARRLAGIDGSQIAYAELNLAHLAQHESRDNRFEPLPELPGADFDLSVVIADSVLWRSIEEAAGGAHELISVVSYVDEYRGTWVPDGHRSLTLRVALQPADATLTAEIIGSARATVLDRLAREFDAHLR